MKRLCIFAGTTVSPGGRRRRLLNLTPDNLVGFSRLQAVSPSGACRPFDARADGFVMGEGIGVVMLKRLADARRDGDRVYALIRGVGCNNDGRGEGPMTPRAEGQVDAMQRAHRDAGDFPVETIEFVETTVRRPLSAMSSRSEHSGRCSTRGPATR